MIYKNPPSHQRLFSMEWGKKRSLEFDFSVEEPVAADNLQLEGAFEVRGEVEGGGVCGNDDGIDHILILVHQLERAAVTRRLKRQLIFIQIYGKRILWRPGMRRSSGKGVRFV